MNRLMVVAAVVVVAGGIGAGGLVRAQDAAPPPQMPEMPPAPEQHEFLQRMAGEWVTEGEMTPGPDQAPLTSKGVERGEMVGGWLVMRGDAEMMGMTFSAIQTLGWMPEEKRFVGTWIDSAMMHLWQYTGSLDDAGRVLTLHTKGPMHTGEVHEFRETIEFVTPDHRVYTSSMRGESGEWEQIVTWHSRRKK